MVYYNYNYGSSVYARSRCPLNEWITQKVRAKKQKRHKNENKVEEKKLNDGSREEVKYA
jgi:hypothetical protein